MVIIKEVHSPPFKSQADIDSAYQSGQSSGYQSGYNAGNSAGIWSTNSVKLWSNPNPTSNFAAQTINVDLSNYKFAVIELIESTANQTHFPPNVTVVSVNSTQCWAIGDQTGALDKNAAYKIYCRSVIVTTSGVTFGIGRCAILNHGSNGQNANNTNYLNNQFAIPIYIYGSNANIYFNK